MRFRQTLAESCRSNHNFTWALAVVLSVGTALAVSCGSPDESSKVDAPTTATQGNVQAETEEDRAQQKPSLPVISPEGKLQEVEPRHVEDLLAPKPDLGPRDYDDGLTDVTATEDDESSRPDMTSN